MSANGPPFKITNEHATVDTFRLPLLMRHAKHAQEGYTARLGYGADFKDRGVKDKKVWLNGNNVVYKEHQVPRLFEDDPETELIHVVRLKIKETSATPGIDGVCIDDSFYELDENSHPDDRIPYIDTTDPEWQPMKVLKNGLATNAVSAEIMRWTIMEQFAIKLGRNILFELAPRPEGLT